MPDKCGRRAASPYLSQTLICHSTPYSLRPSRRGIAPADHRVTADITIVFLICHRHHIPRRGITYEMDHLSIYARRPIVFLLRYVRRRPQGPRRDLPRRIECRRLLGEHPICSEVIWSTPWAKVRRIRGIWLAFAFLVTLVAADNLLWRLAGWISSHAFVGVTGDLRGELFRHLTGHAPSYFADRLGGTLTGRVTATSNAAFAIGNLFIWNVLPPCVATIVAVAYLATVSLPMTAVLTAIAAGMIYCCSGWPPPAQPLHHGFADKAARVEGELADVIGNMPLVRTFGAAGREHVRFDKTLGQEMTARRKSLLYLEKIRLLHAVITATLAIAVLAWAIVLWQRGQASGGDVVLVCTLGFTILHATRDLAVALVDVTQHMARLAEAIATLLQPHVLRDPVGAAPLQSRHHDVVFEKVSFAYPAGRPVLEDFSLRFEAGQRTGLVGPSGSGKSTILKLAATPRRRRRRTHPDRRPGHRADHAGKRAARHLLCAAGHQPAASPGSGQYPLRQARGMRRRGQASGRDGVLPGFHRGAAGGLCHRRRRAWRAPVRRPASAHRHCPGTPQGFADTAARRGDLLARQRIRRRPFARRWSA